MLVLTDRFNVATAPNGSYRLTELTLAEVKDVVSVYDDNEIVSVFSDADMLTVLQALADVPASVTVADSYPYSRDAVYLVVTDSGYKQLSFVPARP